MENRNALGARADAVTSELGARVRELRQARGWTQAQLAEALAEAGLPLGRVTISKLESNDRPTTVAELVALGSVLEVPLDQLLVSRGEDTRRELNRAGDAQVRAMLLDSKVKDLLGELAEVAELAHDVRSSTLSLVARHQREAEQLRAILRAERGKPDGEH